MKLLKRMKKQAALVCALSMVLGMQVPTMASDFSSHWAKDVITEWSNYGVVNGYEDGSFRPNNNMTRAEFAAVLSNVFGLVDTDKNISFADVKMGAWYETAINKVATAGIMNGVAAGKFNPSATITRQEAAAALANAYLLTEKGNKPVAFKDEASIAAWAKEQVEILASNGYINGRADGKFDPRANITRAEVLAMFDNLTGALVNKAGTYTKDNAGNVVVNTQDVTLKDMTIKGNLYLAQGINLGDVTLENVTVEGTIYVAGGGVNSIHLINVTAQKPVQMIAQKAVRLVTEGKKVNVVVSEGEKVVLTGIFGEVVLPADASLELKGAQVDKITVVKASHSEKGTLTIDSTSVVKELVMNAVVDIKGTGKIEKLYANVEGIKTDIKPGTITGEAVDAPTSGAAGGGGGGSSTTTKPSTSGTTTEKKQYIDVSSIKIQGAEVLGNGIDVDDNEVTINLRTLKSNFKDKEIESAIATVTNLNTADTITVKAEGKQIASRSVAAGQVTYNVSDFAGLLAGKKNTIKGLLADYHVDAQAESIAQDYFGKSVDQLLSKRSSVNVANLVDGYDKLLAAYQEGSSQDVKDVAAVLESKGIKLDTKEISYDVSVTTGALGTKDYTIKVVF